jgi:sugar lactone lactonase YvrE
VAFDGAGDLFMADASGNRIFELPAVSGPDLGLSVRADHLTVVAGAGASRLDDPQGIAVDGAGDLFVADTAGCQVDEIPDHAVTESDGVVHRPGHLFAVAGTAVCGYGGDGGPATAARLWSPSAVAVDSSGNVLIADEGNSAVREVAAVTGTYYGVAITAGDIATVAGQDTNSAYLADGLSATGDISALNYPSGVAVDAAGNLFVADSYDRCIRMVPAASGSLFGRSVTVGDMYTLVGVLPTGGGSVPLGDGTRWILARVTYPAAVAAGPGGVLYFSDDGANTVRRVTGS